MIEKLLAANGVRNDLDIALFDADHDIAPAHLLTLARNGYTERPSIYGDDVLGWALARSGRCNEALQWSKPLAAARHEGRVEGLPPRLDRGMHWQPRGGGGLVSARARAQPDFSILWAPVARKGAHA